MARIQQLNLGYMAQKDIGEMVEACFRKPKEGEHVVVLNAKEMLLQMQQEYPNIKVNQSEKVSLGRAMKELGYESHERGHRPYYHVIPLRPRHLKVA